jgi:NAD(P)H-dependent FMN reductase
VLAFEGLRDLPPFDPDVADGTVEAVERWRRALHESDAVLIACPEYGFSLPGVLKNAIDWVIGSAELEGKIVATTASVAFAERGRRGLEALHVPLRAVSARIVGGHPIVKGPRFDQDVAALLTGVVREIERGDASPRRIEVWFDFASTYSYLAVSRVEDFAHRARIETVWRPFLLGPVFQKQGWNDSPFNLYPAKGRHMWRDLERECERAALPFQRPSAFPATVSVRHDWPSAQKTSRGAVASFAPSSRRTSRSTATSRCPRCSATSSKSSICRPWNGWSAPNRPSTSRAFARRPSEPSSSGSSERRRSSSMESCSGGTTDSTRPSPGRDVTDA